MGFVSDEYLLGQPLSPWLGTSGREGETPEEKWLLSAAIISAPRKGHLFFSGSLLNFPRESLPHQLCAPIGTVPAAQRSDSCLFFCLLFL